MRNNTIHTEIPDILFSVLEFSGCVVFSFILGVCFERTKCCDRRGRIDLN